MDGRNILAIDPGTTASAYVATLGTKILGAAKLPNGEMIQRVRELRQNGFRLVIEEIESFGMPVGREVFQTVKWSGRYAEAFGDDSRLHWMPRREVKMHLCNSVRAKDSNIRQALIDKLGAIGTAKNRGPLYGIKGDEWSALAIAVTFAETWYRGNTAEEVRTCAS